MIGFYIGFYLIGISVMKGLMSAVIDMWILTCFIDLCWVLYNCGHNRIIYLHEKVLWVGCGNKDFFLSRIIRKSISVLKANHLVYIIPKWYGSWIYADCQQNVLSSEHDTGRRIFLVTFLAEQKRESNARGYWSLTQRLYFFVNVHFISLLKCTQICT